MRCRQELSHWAEVLRRLNFRNQKLLGLAAQHRSLGCCIVKCKGFPTVLCGKGMQRYKCRNTKMNSTLHKSTQLIVPQQFGFSSASCPLQPSHQDILVKATTWRGESMWGGLGAPQMTTWLVCNWKLPQLGDWAQHGPISRNVQRHVQTPTLILSKVG